ncbi:MAG TPA: ribonucleotide-diphosphate reductase subunit beta [Solirubrobacteraceae bacterium]|jgi:putative sterol carrier protein|nr:ribonucleotide-diphosphate reductase subunit beta [Solirubrobacteraceae bacterium]
MAAATVTIPPATAQIDYADLYARWERGNWCATEIDLSQDRIDWHERMTAEQRRGALWLFSLFFHGEDAVADTLSPYVDAAPLQEQKYFLTTQQVDEARHSVLFKRFMHEVVGVGDGSVGGTLRATMPELTWGHRQTFGYLDDMAARLRRSPDDRRLLASAITLYHVMIEGGLAQAGQHTIEGILDRLDLLPGFREGMRQVSNDEQRHIAFGVRVLADLYAEDPQPIQDAIVGTFREVLPLSTCVAQIPDWDLSYTRALGYELEDLFEEGARMQEARLRAIGLPLDDVPNFPLPLDVPPRERGERGIKLMKAQYLGPKEGAFVADDEATEILFDQMRRQVVPEHAEPGTVIQWDFTDAEPWHLVIDDGRTRVARGRAPRPSLVLRSTLEDWVDVTAGRADPARLMLRRRLRARGQLRLLLRLPKLFA